MAHRNRRRKNTRVYTNPRLRFFNSSLLGVAPSFRPSWTTFTPSRFRPTTVLYSPVRTLPRNDRPFGVKSRAIARTPTFSLTNQPPASKVVSLCERRSERREVMFATNKAGRGGQRKQRRSIYSSVGC